MRELLSRRVETHRSVCTGFLFRPFEQRRFRLSGLHGRRPTADGDGARNPSACSIASFPLSGYRHNETSVTFNNLGHKA
jgi:hypothetical protein